MDTMQLCPNFSLQASALRPARIKAYNRTIVKQSIPDFEQFYPNSEAAQNPTVERRRAACGRRSWRQGDHLPSAPPAPVRPAAKNNPDRPQLQQAGGVSRGRHARPTNR
jgi:hypothetical protein